MEYQAIVTAAAAEARHRWAEQVAQGIYDPLRLYVVPSTADRAGRLVWGGAETPHGAVPVCGDVLHGGIAADHYWQWVYERAARAPLYATGAACA